MRFLISCPFGLSNILGKELKYLGLTPQHIFETGIYTTGEVRDMIQINLWSRIANKVYLELAYGKCLDFDQLFALIQSVSRDQYLQVGQAVVVHTTSKASQLDSTRTIQSISNKAIYKQISPDKNWDINEQISPLEVFVLIENNQASVFLNSSGAPLHQRGYRTETGEAPIKENIAAALILLNAWKFSQALWDPCCGSGTIGIEAAMLARNIAPGLKRSFAFEYRKKFDSKLLDDLRADAISKQYPNKIYQIVCSDSDSDIIEKAKRNAEQAGVGDTITFLCENFLTTQHPGMIITNPPYGKRLSDLDLEQFYTHLITTIQTTHNGGFITSYHPTQRLDSQRRRKKLYNGADECTLWMR